MVPDVRSMAANCGRSTSRRLTLLRGRPFWKVDLQKADCSGRLTPSKSNVGTSNVGIPMFQTLALGFEFRNRA